MYIRITSLPLVVPNVDMTSLQDHSVPPPFDDIKLLVAEHMASSRWFDIGLVLGVDQSSLEVIREKNTSVENDDTACSEMLLLWLSSNEDKGLPCTMDMVLQALEEVMKEDNVNREDIHEDSSNHA